MMNFKKPLLSLVTLTVLSGAINSANALPSGGDWQTDRNARSEWIELEAMNSIETVNFILCFMNDFWLPSQANKGPYKAQVNETKCEGGGGDSSAGGKLTDVIAELSITADGKTEGKLWIPDGSWDDVAEPMVTFARVLVTESPSASNPNGIFEVVWNDVGKNTSTLYFSGRMTATASGVDVHSEESINNQSRTDKLYLSGNLNSGSGAVFYQEEIGNNSVVDVYLELGFNNDVACFKQTGANDQCYSRSRSAAGAKRYSWRYGAYDLQGNRLDLPNPSFNIRSENNQWGSANRWGVWSNEAWQNGITVRQVSGVDVGRTFTYVTYPGRLTEDLQTHSKVVNPSSRRLDLSCSSGCKKADGSLGSNLTYHYQNGLLYESSAPSTAISTSDRPGIHMQLTDLTDTNKRYYYQSGPDNWQQFTGLKKSDESFVEFSEPILFNSPRGGILSFDGHGSIGGIPTKTYLRSDMSDRVDDEPGDWFNRSCTNNRCRWVPDYLINDEQVTINGSTYFIQWLQSNLVPAEVVGPTPSDISFGSISNLPSGSLPRNVRGVIGEVPNLSSDTPILIIEGKVVVQ